MKIYLKSKRALAFFHQKATPEYWDHHWKIENLRSHILAVKSDTLFIPAVKTYLSPGSLVLEGGCGRGALVHALQYQGYNAIGIDFAQATVESIHQAAPELDIRAGDVRNLPIENDTLDGYVSVGVIEHFWEGYEKIFFEMKRTIKPGGFLFVSFPYMSPLRKLKRAFNGYSVHKIEDVDHLQATFYQFALDWKSVVHDLHNYGFCLKQRKPFDGIKGFKDEFTWFKPWLQPIYDGKRPAQWKRRLNKVFTPFAAHCILLVFQKTA